MVWAPGGSVRAGNVAISWPTTTDSGTGACARPSVANTTLPVGRPAPLDGVPVTEITVRPNVAGPGDELSVRVVVARPSTARPIELVPPSVNQRLPSGPVVIWLRLALA